MFRNGWIESTQGIRLAAFNSNSTSRRDPEGGHMLADKLIAATEEALREVTEARFFRSERGFQGQFLSTLQRSLNRRGLLRGGCILEMEYQKSGRHGMRQRPDIILHIPAEISGGKVTENNFALWALKRRATQTKAREDFCKLDMMFDKLCYPLGFFINIDAKDHLAASYGGKFPERLRTVAVWLDGTIKTSLGSPSCSAATRHLPKAGR